METKKTYSLKDIEKDYNVKVIYASIVGSKLYGTNTEQSDVDIRFIYQSSQKDVILGNTEDTLRCSPQTSEKNTADDIDFDGWSLPYFFKLIENGDTNAFDLLFSMFSNSVIFETEISLYIKEHYKELLNRNVKGFVGYCLSQVKKFGIKGERYNELQKFVSELLRIDQRESISKDEKLKSYWDILKEFVQEENFQYIKFVEAPGPNGETWEYISVLGKMFHKNVKFNYFFDKVKDLEKQFGNRTKNTASLKQKIDPKSTYHALRIALELKELLETEFIQFPLTYSDELLKIKTGDFVYSDVVDKIEKVIDNTDKLLLESQLPEKSNKELIESIIIRSFNEF